MTSSSRDADGVIERDNVGLLCFLLSNQWKNDRMSEFLAFRSLTQIWTKNESIKVIEIYKKRERDREIVST